MKKVTAMLFSMAVGLNAVSMAAKAKASEEQETDVLLIGGGIMSATLGTYLRELGADIVVDHSQALSDELKCHACQGEILITLDHLPKPQQYHRMIVGNHYL